MTRFHEQMKKVRNENEDYNDVFSNDDWTIQDYRDFFWCVVYTLYHDHVVEFIEQVETKKRQ